MTNQPHSHSGPVVVLDIDGVLANYHEALGRVGKFLGTLPMDSDVCPAPSKYFPVCEGWFSNHSDLQDAVDFIKDNHLLLTLKTLDPEVGCYVAAAQAFGAFIHIVSSRPKSTEPETRLWLESEGIPFDSLTCDIHLDKTSLGFDIIVEDHPGTLAKAFSRHPDRWVIALDHSYNRSAPCYYRWDTLSGLPDLVEQWLVVSGTGP